jgi:hypothetical protein
VGQYFIIYNQGKSLFIGKGGQQRINLYWVGQYYRDEEVQDLQEVKKRGEQLIAELASIGIRPKKLTSPVTLFEDALYKLKIPTHLQMPVEVNRMAWKCSRKQWTEAHVLGHFEYTWDYDLNSAFPGAMAELLNCSSEYGDWVHEKAKPLGAVYASYKGWWTSVQTCLLLCMQMHMVISSIPEMCGLHALQHRTCSASQNLRWAGLKPKTAGGLCPRKKSIQQDNLFAFYMAIAVKAHY